MSQSIKRVLVGPGRASRALEVSTESIRRFATTGVLPCIRTEEGRLLFELAAVEKLKEQRQARKAARVAG